MRHQTKTNFYLLLTILFSAILSSCAYDIESDLGNLDCEHNDVSYSLEVLPIIDDACYNCHGNGETSGGIDLDGYDAIISSVLNGKLLCSINHDDDCEAMPQSAPKLPDCDIVLIRTWIDEGAENN